MLSRQRKLGRLAPRPGLKLLRLEKYLHPDLASLPPLPTSLDWTGKLASWPMMGNDKVGDCTIATVGHMVECWTANAQGNTVVIPDSEILATYTAITAQENHGQGYNPVTGANDNGCVVTDVLNYWQKTGIGGHKILGYVSVNPHNLTHVKRAVQLFGGVYLGVDLPLTAQTQVDAGQPWSVVWPTTSANSEPGSWGGHAIPVLAYTPADLTCITWGAKQLMTPNWFYYYCEEAYAIVTQDWLNSLGVSPVGLNLAALKADLGLVAN